MAYWLITGVIVSECAVGGVMDLNAAAHQPLGSLIAPTAFVGLAFLSRALLPARASRN